MATGSWISSRSRIRSPAVHSGYFSGTATGPSRPPRTRHFTVGHLKRAILFSLNRSGAHGLPCGLSADWNDCIRLGDRGESVFVAFQLRYALSVYLEVSHLLASNEEKAWAQSNLDCHED